MKIWQEAVRGKDLASQPHFRVDSPRGVVSREVEEVGTDEIVFGNRGAFLLFAERIGSREADLERRCPERVNSRDQEPSSLWKRGIRRVSDAGLDRDADPAPADS